MRAAYVLAFVAAVVEGRVAAETRNIMEAFGTLLAELGMDFGDVVQGTVFLADIEISFMAVKR